jgi:2-oxoglutarate ferredoxin oxidoreductase subunit delta
LNKIVIDKSRCKGCGLCIQVCPKKILSFDAKIVNELGHHPVSAEGNCAACGLCALICPDIVFSIYRDVKEAGESGKASLKGK